MMTTSSVFLRISPTSADNRIWTTTMIWESRHRTCTVLVTRATKVVTATCLHKNSIHTNSKGNIPTKTLITTNSTILNFMTIVRVCPVQSETCIIVMDSTKSPWWIRTDREMESISVSKNTTTSVDHSLLLIILGKMQWALEEWNECNLWTHGKDSTRKIKRRSTSSHLWQEQSLQTSTFSRRSTLVASSIPLSSTEPSFCGWSP